MPVLTFPRYEGPDGPAKFNAVPNGSGISIVAWPDDQATRPRTHYRPSWISDFVSEREIDRGPGAQTDRGIRVVKIKSVSPERAEEITASFSTEEPEPPPDPLAGSSEPILITDGSARQEAGLFDCPDGYWLHSRLDSGSRCVRNDLKDKVRNIGGELMIIGESPTDVVARPTDVTEDDPTTEPTSTVGGATGTSDVGDNPERPPEVDPRPASPTFTLEEGADGSADSGDADAALDSRGKAILVLLAVVGLAAYLARHRV